MKLHRIAILLSAFCLALGAVAEPIAASQIEVLLGSSKVTGRSPANEEYGDFYVLQFTPPEGLTSAEIEEAYLELFVDADSRIDAEVLPGPARIEVYLLSRSTTGDVALDDLAVQTRMARNVPIGSDRFVRLNVTKAVRQVLEAPEENYGLVIGSLTGGRDGVFELKRGSFPDGTDARLVFSTTR